MSEKLLPCPFCGGRAEEDRTDEGGEFIKCSNCNCATALFFPLMDDVTDLKISAWNIRCKV